MAMTLRELLAQPRLGLVLRCPGGEGDLDATVHWVHQSELSDSTLFTEPGEVLMTTGSQIPDAQQSDPGELAQFCRLYVKLLKETSVVALGFGVGVHHDTTPDALLDAAEQAGLPVFEVPYEIPFSAVIKAVSKFRSDEEHAYLRRTNTAQRRLITAAGRPNVPQAVINSAAQIIDGWAALTDADSRVQVRSQGVVAEVARAAATTHLASSQLVSFPDAAGRHVCAHSIIGADGEVRGVMLAGTPAELDPQSISTAMLAANLLGIYLSLSARLDSALGRLRTLLIREALAGDAELLRRTESSIWPRIPAGRVILFCVTGPATEIARMNRFPAAAVWGQVDDRLWLAVEAGKAETVADQLTQRPELSFGRAAACSWADLPQARHQALSSLLIKQQPQPTGRMSLLELLPPDQALAFAHDRLGQLLAPASAELLTTLQAWLGTDGSFDQTAEELGVHRHTVRRRIQRAEQLLGITLDRSEQRHELWFACAVLARSGQAPRNLAAS